MHSRYDFEFELARIASEQRRRAELRLFITLLVAVLTTTQSNPSSNGGNAVSAR